MYFAIFAALFLVLWVVFLRLGPAIANRVAELAKRTADMRRRDYLGVVLVIAAGLALTIILGDAFLDLAESVRADSPRLREIDRGVHAWATSARTPFSTAFLRTMTEIGSVVPLGLLVSVATAALIVQRRWSWAIYVAAVTASGGLLNLQLKLFFARGRPELAAALAKAHGYAFPSGHAMGSTIVFGVLAWVAMRQIKNWTLRAAALALAFSLIVAISFSRVYLGVHWMSDIGAGITAGLLWVIATTVAFETAQRIRRLRAMRRMRAEEAKTAAE